MQVRSNFVRVLSCGRWGSTLWDTALIRCRQSADWHAQLIAGTIRLRSAVAWRLLPGLRHRRSVESISWRNCSSLHSPNESMRLSLGWMRRQYAEDHVRLRLVPACHLYAFWLE